MSDAKVPPSYRHILCVLTEDMSIKALAEATGYCERQLKRILPAMAERGLINRTHRPGKSTIYAPANMSQDATMSYDKMSHRDILTRDIPALPEPELSNARTHEAREESLVLSSSLVGIEKEKEKDSAAKKTRRASSPKSPKPPTIREIPEDLRPRFELIARLTNSSLNSPTIWNYHHLLSGTVSSKRGKEDWYTYQIVGGLSDDALRQFIGYQKRQHELAQRPGKFFLRKPETINNLVNLWLDKRAAQDAERALFAQYSSGRAS